MTSASVGGLRSAHPRSQREGRLRDRSRRQFGRSRQAAIWRDVSLARYPVRRIRPARSSERGATASCKSERGCHLRCDDLLMRTASLVTVRLARPEEFDAIGDLVVAAYNSIPDAVADPDYDSELRRVAARATMVSVLVAVSEHAAVLGSLTYVP